MVNQLVERGYLTQSLGSASHSGEHALKTVPGLLKLVLKERAWERRIIVETGEEFDGFPSFETYIKANPPRGVGVSIEVIDTLIDKDEELRAQFHTALSPLLVPRHPQGERSPEPSTCLYCQAIITQPAHGRKRSFCSGKCRTAYAREKQREADEQAKMLEFNRLFPFDTRSKKALIRGVMPETSDFLQDVLARYGLQIAQLVAQGIQVEKDAQKESKRKKKADPIVVDAHN